MPRTTRSSKSTAPSPAPLSNLQSDKAQETLDKAVQETGIEVDPEPEQDEEEQETKMTRTTRTSGDAKGKGKAKAIADEVEEVVVEEQEPEQEQGQGKKVSPEERLAKLKELRTRMVSLPPSPISFLSTVFRDDTPNSVPSPDDRTNPHRPTGNP